ncbi:MAG: M48 family metallopeptidase [Gammaproteobacteria bacterium]
MQRLTCGRCALVLAIACAPLFGGVAHAKGKVEENNETVYLARDFVFVDSPAIEGYLRGVCKRLLDAKGVKLEGPNILVQSSDAFNAFTDAHGNLVISTGALRSLESEDELAALLGHELSHLILKHPQDKDAMRVLPLGMETMSSMKDAATELRGRGDVQATSVLWSDFIAPSWNRKQEQEADENGFELMRAAGYDPSTFGQLFSKLRDAEKKRSERMQVLKKALVARLREAAPDTKIQAVSMTGEVGNAVADGASEKLIDGLAAFNRSYESPDERQTHLAVYAREHREKKRAAHPEAGFQEALQMGEGGTMLTLDGAALGTLDALARKNAAAARTAVESLGTGETKQTSAHLNLALGSYQQAYGKPEAGAAAAQSWLLATHPSAQAFLWSASYKVKARDYEGALETLESGRMRVGDSTPFMPTLIATARASGNLALAREYTKECRAESSRDSGLLQSVVSRQSSQSTLYAECVRQLGEKPAEDAVAESVVGKARESVFNLLRKK